tara:strand:- start:355 stop:525 length:171 start_codon:yes stop_codon:yes gene_type:complete
MSNNKEIFSQQEYERLVNQEIEVSKKKLEKAFEKLEKDENFNRKIKTISDRRKHTR